MKSENGVTLVALITILLVLITLTSVGIYSGINSYKVINLQKYKAQMQLIQNEVDELYEKNENNKLLGKDIEVYGTNDDFTKIDSFWNEEVAGNFGILLDSKDYYLLAADEIEEKFNLEDIDISEYFIINFEKRLVFSITPIEVISGKNDDGTDKYEKIYCLYQLDEEEKIIEFKTTGNFRYTIYKEDNKQIVEITNNINIENVKIDTDRDGEYEENINAKKDYCIKVVGLNTKKVTLEIIKDCKIKVMDAFENTSVNDFILYNTPILEKNMIPIIVMEKEKGKITNVEDANWYNYYTYIDEENKKVIDEKNTNFAVAINAKENNFVNVSNTVNTILTIPKTDNNQSVKVWIPKNLREIINNTYGTIYVEEDFKGTGMWVEAYWNGEKYVPANGEIK